MNGIAFDTLAAARALREAGFEERQAEAVIGVVRRAVGADRDSLATKAAFAALSADIDTGFAALRADIATLRADIYLALWVQGAGIVAAMAELIAAFKLFG